MSAHRLIIDPPQSGARNMAVDESLLIEAAEHDVATLRLYRWSEPTLSLGYFQNYEDRRHHPASEKCAIVRRQTGGGAILHDRELTYSIVLPAGNRLVHRSESLYTKVHDAFIAVLTGSPPVGSSSVSLRRNNEVSKHRSEAEPFLCFERRAIGDVVVVPSNFSAPSLIATADTRCGNVDFKVLGSAQRRSRGVLLQHGSLLLEKSPAAPELPGLADLTGWGFSDDQCNSLVERIYEVLGLEFVPGELPREVELNARELANKKYGSATWTKRR